MSEPSLEQFDRVLAAPPRRPWRLLIVVTVSALAVALIAAGVVIRSGKPALPRAASPIAMIKDPLGSKGASAGAFSPDGKVLAINDDDGRTYLWDLAPRRWIGTLQSGPCQGGAIQVMFSPDGKTLAVIGGQRSDGSPSGLSCLWDVASGRQVATFAVPLRPLVADGVAASGGVAGAAFSPDGRILAIADSDGDTCLWDVATGRKLAVLTDPHATDPDSTTFVDSVAFRPDGKTLAVGDGNGNVYLWDVASRG